MYQAGEDFSDAEVVRLHINESPRLPPISAITAAARALTDARHYPDPEALSLRNKIAEFHEVDVENVVVGAGGDGLLEGIFRAFGRGAVTLTRPTYGVLTDLADHYATRTRTIDWAVRLDAPYTGGGLFCIVNPNSPTGSWCPPVEFARCLPDHGPVVAIDEAYAPFVDDSMIPLLRGHSKWVVVRSFSKIYALAGLRIGYAVGARKLIAAIRAAEGPYPVTGVALAAAEAALQDREYLTSAVADNRRLREQLAGSLAQYGWDPGVSEGNFLFARPPGGDAAYWKESLLAEGIAVRMFPNDDPARLRISVGSGADLSDLMRAVVTISERLDS